MKMIPRNPHLPLSQAGSRKRGFDVDCECDVTFPNFPLRPKTICIEIVDKQIP